MLWKLRFWYKNVAHICVITLWNFRPQVCFFRSYEQKVLISKKSLLTTPEVHTFFYRPVYFIFLQLVWKSLDPFCSNWESGILNDGPQCKVECENLIMHLNDEIGNYVQLVKEQFLPRAMSSIECIIATVANWTFSETHACHDF